MEFGIIELYYIYLFPYIFLRHSIFQNRVEHSRDKWK
jgi:hypothetical protein